MEMTCVHNRCKMSILICVQVSGFSRIVLTIQHNMLIYVGPFYLLCVTEIVYLYLGAHRQSLFVSFSYRLQCCLKLLL